MKNISAVEWLLNEINMANRRGTVLEDEKTLEIFNRIVEDSGIKVRVLDYDLKWIKQIVEHYENK